VLTQVDIPNDITCKILGDITITINIGGTCPPCHIGIDAPGKYSLTKIRGTTD